MRLTVHSLNNLLINSPYRLHGHQGTILKFDDTFAIKLDSRVIPSVLDIKGIDRCLNNYALLETTYSLNLESLMSYYNSVRANICLTTLPSDIVYYKNTPIGILTKYFKNSKTLDNIKCFKRNDLISLFYDLIYIVNELNINKIYDNDICLENILIFDNSLQVVDLDDTQISYGVTDPTLENEVYKKVAAIISYLALNLVDSKSRSTLGIFELFNETKNDPLDFNTTKNYVDKIKKLLRM